jgi:ribosomal protein S2
MLYVVTMDPREEDITKMLAAGVHIGTSNSDPKMADYIWKRRVVRFRYF